MNHIWFCEYCSPTGSHESRKHFLTQKDFVNHIRAHHLVHIFKNDVEMFICRYGPNNSCLLSKDPNTFDSSFSSHGTVFTSQRDYEKHLVGFHLLKHPVYKNVDTKSSQPAHTVVAHCDKKPSRKWSVHQSVVNLPALLNDPNYRETDIFAKLWGDKFENAEVLPSPHLPVITEKHFVEYLNKIGIRKSDTDSCRSSPKCQTNSLSNSFSDSSPSVKSSDKVLNDKQSPSLEISLNSVPALYFDQTFNLKDEKTFCQVIPLHLRRLCLQNSRNPFEETGSSSVTIDSVNISKTRQREAFRTQHDKLVNYLDIIELNIAEQVSRKSSTFFEAIQCHDVIRGDLSQAIGQIKDVRHKLQQIDTYTIIDKMKLLRIVRRRENYRLIVDKLKLISSLQATQPTIQTLLRNNDFCAALDLVSTTKELLHSHLMVNSSSSDISSERMVNRTGNKNSTQDSVIPFKLNNNSTTFLCLRDFNAQLNGISNFIHKMVESEFEISLCRYLDPPVEEYGSGFNEPDILSCFLGLIRINRLDFVSGFHAEMRKRVKDIISQHTSSITQSLKNDYITQKPNTAILPISDQLRNIPYEDWMAFLVNLCNDLKYLLIRGQDVVEIFENNLCSNDHYQQSVETVGISSTHHHQSLNIISLDKAKELAKYMRKTLWDTANVAQKRLSSLISVRFRLAFNQSITEPNLATSMTTPALSSTTDSSLHSPNSSQKRSSSITPIDMGFTTVHSEYAFDKVNWNDFRELVKVMNIFQVYVLRTWLKFFDVPIETIIHRQSDHSDNYTQPNSLPSNYKSESCVKQLMVSFNHNDDMTPSTIVNHNVNGHYLSNNQYTPIPTIHSDLILSNLVLSMSKLIIDRFHREKCDKLNMLLDQERWQAAVCPEQVQQMIDDIFTKVEQSKINSSRSSNEHSSFSPNHSIQSTNNVTRSPNSVFLNDEQYTVVGTVILFLPMIYEYVKLDEKLPSQPLATEFILDRLADLLNHFNSRVCQLVLGAEACKTVDLQRISAKNLALTLRSLQLVVHFLPCIRYSLERISEAELNKVSMNVDNLLIASFYRCNNHGINRTTLNLDLDHVEKLFNEHIESILQKLAELLSDPISQHFSTWYGRPPIPSKQMKELCRNLSKLIETTSQILPSRILTSILLRVHNELKVQLRHRISELGIIADGGPQQSLIDSEILYYIDHLQSLTPQLQKFIDDCSDIWPSL
ncbi:Vacuolar protein sorting-associated protein 54 [Schistosoma japonicum]|nr:Vacuolar protein sorting-associated protein 54 [Schistosoma japonicum]